MKAVIATFIAVFLALFPTQAFSQVDVAQQVNCLAIGMYHEARAESVEGIKAVGYVILNRTRYPKAFASTPCGVLYQKNQFDRIAARKITDQKSFRMVFSLAEQVYANQRSDNTGGATHFHALKAKPNWPKLKRTVRIGGHIFLKGNYERLQQPVPLQSVSEERLGGAEMDRVEPIR